MIELLKDIKIAGIHYENKYELSHNNIKYFIFLLSLQIHYLERTINSYQINTRKLIEK